MDRDIRQGAAARGLALRSLLALALAVLCAGCLRGPVEDRVTHGYAVNEGVRIHYASLGEGPLMVMIHGYPDFWLTWWRQMERLSKDYQVVAIDLRGYNLSDKPQGPENYRLPVVAADVVAVIRHLGHEKAIIVGHDWGGMVAWELASGTPEAVDQLILLNAPHPRNLLRELVENPEQRRRSEYAQNFKRPRVQKQVAADRASLVLWARSMRHRKAHLEALGRTDFDAVFSYYVVNYPGPPYSMDPSPAPQVEAPILMIHGLQDPVFSRATLHQTVRWTEERVTLVVIPEAGHWVQHDAPGRVASAIETWLGN